MILLLVLWFMIKWLKLKWFGIFVFMFSIWLRYVDNGKLYVKLNNVKLLFKLGIIKLWLWWICFMDFIFLFFKGFVSLFILEIVVIVFFGWLFFEWIIWNGVIVVFILVVIGVVKGFVLFFLLFVLLIFVILGEKFYIIYVNMIFIKMSSVKMIDLICFLLFILIIVFNDFIWKCDKDRCILIFYIVCLNMIIVSFYNFFWNG